MARERDQGPTLSEDLAERVASILFPAPKRTEGFHYVSEDVIDNLEGAIQNLKTLGGNPCVTTLERILIKLAAVRDLVKT